MPGKIFKRWPISFALATFLLLPQGAPVHAAQTVSTDSIMDMSIAVGRLGAMIDKTEDALDTGDAAGANPAAADAEAVFRDLKAEVLHYDLALMRACDTRTLSGKSCGQLYLPSWLKDGPDVRHSEAQLRAMIGEATAQIALFWTVMCTMGVAKGDEHACDIE